MQYNLIQFKVIFPAEISLLRIFISYQCGYRPDSNAQLHFSYENICHTTNSGGVSTTTKNLTLSSWKFPKGRVRYRKTIFVPSFLNRFHIFYVFYGVKNRKIETNNCPSECVEKFMSNRPTKRWERKGKNRVCWNWQGMANGLHE